MSPLHIIVPSRGRPQNAYRLLNQIKSTTPAGSDISMIFAVDADDPTFEFYPEEHTVQVEGGTMVKALNELAVPASLEDEYIAFLGDDTLPLYDWYEKIMTALRSQKNSIVYGNDLINGQNLPTAIFMDSNVVRTLGFMAPPAQKHLYVDNFWKALGETLGTLTYIDNAIIEHLHPHGGKAPSDLVYEAAYTPERWNHDQTAFVAYMETNFFNDVQRFA